MNLLRWSILAACLVFIFGYCYNSKVDEARSINEASTTAMSEMLKQLPPTAAGGH